MAKNRNDTVKGASAKTAGRGGSGGVQRGGGPTGGKGGKPSAQRSNDTGRVASKNGAPEKSQTGNPYAGLTRLVGKVRARDPYSSESW